MKTILIAAVMVSAGFTAASAYDQYGSGYGPLDPKTGVRQGPFNCDKPIVPGGSRLCPAGRFPRVVRNIDDYAAFTKGGGGGGDAGSGGSGK